MKKMRMLIRSKKGFTLMELLIGMTVLVIILAATTELIQTEMMSIMYNRSMSVILPDGATALSLLVYYVGKAQVASLPTAGSSASQFSFTDSGSYTWNIYSSGNSIVIATSNPDYPSSQLLARQVVNSLTFSRDLAKSSYATACSYGCSSTCSTVADADSNVVSVSFTVQSVEDRKRGTNQNIRKFCAGVPFGTRY